TPEQLASLLTEACFLSSGPPAGAAPAGRDLRAAPGLRARAGRRADRRPADGSRQAGAECAIIQAVYEVSRGGAAAENLKEGVHHMAKHELPALPYAYDALEPYIDAQTMEIHHTKQHPADRKSTRLNSS